MQTQHLLNQLIKFRTEANDQTCRDIFGKLGDHLWGEFVRVEYDVVVWFARLDNLNRAKFTDWLAAEGQSTPGERWIKTWLDERNRDSTHYIPLEGYGRVYTEAVVIQLLTELAGRMSEPTCAECGQALTGEDVEAGEQICLDCGAAVLLEMDGPLSATVRVE